VPSDERLETLAELAASYGLKFDPADGKSPLKLRELLSSLEGKPPGVARALNFLTLRALKQAVYDVVNLGHFGLAAPDYVHFTSPIRRYPDLIVHRLLKSALHADGLPAGGPPPRPPERPVLASMAAESSSNERRAMQAEREVVDLYRAFLMRDHVGDEYEGTVAGVAGFGIFVQIESPFVEGLVKNEALGDDYYELDDKSMRLVGRRSGHSFALGDAVRVRIENVSVQRRKIDMVLVEHHATAVSPRPKRSKRAERSGPEEGPRKRGRNGASERKPRRARRG
jgi:ribonuclease R